MNQMKFFRIKSCFLPLHLGPVNQFIQLLKNFMRGAMDDLYQWLDLVKNMIFCIAA